MGAPDPCGTAITNSTNHISLKIPAQNSAQHKYAHDNRARNGNGIHHQQEVIAALCEIGDTDLADRLQRCMTARQQRHYGDGWPYSLPIVRMLLVSPRNDARMVGGHALLVRGGHNIDPCHHPHTFTSRLIRRCGTAPSRPKGLSSSASHRSHDGRLVQGPHWYVKTNYRRDHAGDQSVGRGSRLICILINEPHSQTSPAQSPALFPPSTLSANL